MFCFSIYSFGASYESSTQSDKPSASRIKIPESADPDLCDFSFVSLH